MRLAKRRRTTAGMPEHLGRLPPMRYSTTTKKTKQMLTVQLNPQIGEDGVTHVRSFTMEMA